MDHILLDGYRQKYHYAMETKTNTPTFTFFWTTSSPFSQWHTAKFQEGTTVFSNAEQYMMYHKAKLFGDTEIMEKILKATDPKTIKNLGRKVKNFNETMWQRNRKTIVLNGNYLKFSQNPHLRQALIDTAPTRMVEASPYDKIWGIGMRASDPRCQNPNQWQGLNLLGLILDETRERLVNESQDD